MFNDRLFEIIIEEMMSEFGADVRTDEGSLAYNACAKIAQKLEEVYGDMDELNDNTSLLTMDLPHLIDYGAERSIEYKCAISPIVRAVFNDEQEIGKRFICNNFVYTITEKIIDFEYKMICETEGADANANFGNLEPEEYLDNFSGGEIVEILTLGKEDEDEEKYRQKLINAENQHPFGGNKDYYQIFVNSIDGVGGCKPKRREKESPWINITVISSDFSVPSDELISLIQEKVDPEESHGEGDGKAPICHNVKIIPVSALDVNISTKIVFEDGADENAVKSQIETVIKEYLIELREKWEETKFNDLIVRKSQIDARILNIAGVADISETKINESGENLTVSYEKIPVFGGVTIV